MMTKRHLQQVRDNAESARRFELHAEKAMIDAKECARVAFRNMFIDLLYMSLELFCAYVTSFMIGYTFWTCESMWGLLVMTIYFLNASFLILYSQNTYHSLVMSCNEFKLFWSLFRYCSELVRIGRVRVGTLSKFRCNLERMEELV